MTDAGNVLSVFDELAGDVAGSSHEFFAANLRQWFTFLDSSPELSTEIQRLESAVDFEAWKQEGLKPQSGIGHGRITFPEEPEPRLGIQLGLFRSLSVSEEEAWRFAHEYVSSERKLNDMTADLVDQVFNPFVRALRRHLGGVLAQPSNLDENRVVTLSRDEAWREAIEALGEAKRVLMQANDPISDEIKSQRIAELTAGRELLEAKQVRVGALVATAGNALRYLGSKFVDVGLGKAATLAWDKILKYLIGSL